MRIGIIDYRMGNLFSLQQACSKMGFDSVVSQDPGELGQCGALILPGVGAFKDAMDHLEALQLRRFLQDFAVSGRVLVGICLGMQLLFQEGEEFGVTPGLGFLPGRVVKFPDAVLGGDYVIPQMGWNMVDFVQPNLKEHFPSPHMYFAHSYYVDGAKEQNVWGKTAYAGRIYPSVVGDKNIIGFQFHPEKSASSGLKLLEFALNKGHLEITR